MFQRLLSERPTPERCVEAYYLQRTRFESIAERKLRRRQLTEDGNVEISGRDLRWTFKVKRNMMPGNPGEITMAERRFRVRIRIAVPPSGLGQRRTQITAWLDANCGAYRWAMTPLGNARPVE